MMTYNQYRQIAGYILIQRVMVFIALYQYLNRLHSSHHHTDHLGSSSIITDNSGNKVEEIYYYPFGGTRLNQGSVNLKHKYTGQEEDAETGLYYYNARYYDPQLGRFISADSIVGNPIDPQDLNRYTYAGNNPLIYIDPTGHLKFKKLWKAVVTGIVGGAVFVLSGGTASPILAGMLAGASAGAASAALNGGNLNQILKSAAIGGIIGGVAGGLYSINPQVMGPALLAAGAIYATATDGLNGLAYYAGGMFGGYLGASGAQYAMESGSEFSEIGGEGNCKRCMPEDDDPGLNVRLKYKDLFEGESKTTSEYGWRKYAGTDEFHGGTDRAPRPNTGIGTPILAPSKGTIIYSTKGAIFFRAEGMPLKSSLSFHHVSILPHLAKSPITVNAGEIIGVLSAHGRMNAPHLHIQLEYKGKLYNPKFVFE